MASRSARARAFNRFYRALSISCAEKRGSAEGVSSPSRPGAKFGLVSMHWPKAGRVRTLCPQIPSRWRISAMRGGFGCCGNFPLPLVGRAGWGPAASAAEGTLIRNESSCEPRRARAPTQPSPQGGGGAMQDDGPPRVNSAGSRGRKPSCRARIWARYPPSPISPRSLSSPPCAALSSKRCPGTLRDRQALP